MKMDLYECFECGRAFAVEDGDDVTCCPSCESIVFEFVHESILTKGGLANETGEAPDKVAENRIKTSRSKS